MKKSDEKIINAAIGMFNKNLPFTLEDVALHAGISRRTLHRHFTGKEELLAACKKTAMASCNVAMLLAYNANQDTIKKLKAMLFAVIDSGSNAVFIKKFYERSSFSQAGGNNSFKGDDVKSKWFRLIQTLQAEGTITQKLSIGWIFNLFGSIADTAILAIDNGDIAQDDARRFAWFSFSKGIELVEDSL